MQHYTVKNKIPHSKIISGIITLKKILITDADDVSVIRIESVQQLNKLP